MTCPNCNKQMQNKSKLYYGLGSWDMDHPDMIRERFVCKPCKISFDDGNWKIPLEYERPTEKQVKCVNIINKVLGTDFAPLLKVSTTQFIKENMQKSKQEATGYNKYTPDEDDIYNICINDVWCEEY